MQIVSIQSKKWLPPHDNYRKLAARSLRKRIELTKQGLVWDVRYSVHTPLGERLLQLASKAPQHAGWFTILSVTNQTLHIFITIRTSFMVHFRKSISNIFKIVEILSSNSFDFYASKFLKDFQFHFMQCSKHFPRPYAIQLHPCLITVIGIILYIENL